VILATTFSFRKKGGVSIEEFTYNSISGAVSNNRRLRIESEDNDKLSGLYEIIVFG
jgi:hypothetical protein